MYNLNINRNNIKSNFFHKYPTEFKASNFPYLGRPYETIEYYFFDRSEKELCLFFEEALIRFKNIEESSNNLKNCFDFFEKHFNWKIIDESNLYNINRCSGIYSWKDILEVLIKREKYILTDISTKGYFLEFEFCEFDEEESIYHHKGVRIKTDDYEVEKFTCKVKKYDELEFISHLMFNLDEDKLTEILTNFIINKDKNVLLTTDKYRVEFHYHNYNREIKLGDISENIDSKLFLKSGDWSFKLICEFQNFEHNFKPNLVIQNIENEFILYPFKRPRFYKIISELRQVQINNKKYISPPKIELNDYRIDSSGLEII
jgi:hypothetical protein